MRSFPSSDFSEKFPQFYNKILNIDLENQLALVIFCLVGNGQFRFQM